MNIGNTIALLFNICIPKKSTFFGSLHKVDKQQAALTLAKKITAIFLFSNQKYNATERYFIFITRFAKGNNSFSDLNFKFRIELFPFSVI